MIRQVVILGWLSDHFKERSLIASLSNIWMLPFFIALVTIPESASPWIRYVLITGINSLPYAHAILVGMTSRNARSVGTRAVSTAVYNMTYQIGSIIAANIYRDGDRPYCTYRDERRSGLCRFRTGPDQRSSANSSLSRLHCKQGPDWIVCGQHYFVHWYEAILHLEKPSAEEEIFGIVRGRKADSH